MGEVCVLNFPFFRHLFLASLITSIILWGIRTVNLICRMIGFQGTCDPPLQYFYLDPKLAAGIRPAGSTFQEGAELVLQQQFQGEAEPSPRIVLRLEVAS